MTIRFAAARQTLAAFFGRGAIGLPPPRAANDNGDNAALEPLLRDALRHFAAHGLGAAEQARYEAERCHAAADTDGYRHWLEICRRLDRRLAAALARRLGTAAPDLHA